MSKSQRAFVFTLFGEVENDDIPVDHDAIKYMIYQLEKCASSGKLHYQGYVELKQKKTFGSMKRLFDDETVHIEFRKGTAIQARDYASKEDTRIRGPWEFGIFSKDNQGKRNDLLIAKEDIDKGMVIDEFVQKHTNVYARHMRFFKEYYAEKNKNVIRDPPYVEVLIGPPGCGKTRKVYDENKLEDIYEVSSGNSGNLWFDGYTQQSVLLLDDFYGEIRFSTLLRLLDRYRFRGEVKGGYVYINPKKIYITSNKDPKEWYGDMDISPLTRRFSVVYNWFGSCSGVSTPPPPCVVGGEMP